MSPLRRSAAAIGPEQKAWIQDGHVRRWVDGGREALVERAPGGTGWTFVLRFHGKELVGGIASTEGQARASADDEIAARGWGGS